MLEICFVTCARLPDLDDDDRLAVEPLRDLGIEVVPGVWDDSSVDWDRFAMTVIRSTWDYTDRRDKFVEWARSVPRLFNPAHVIEWNTDKRYLNDLAAAGIPVVATTFVSNERDLDLPSQGEYVLKPAVGAGSIGADRYDLADGPARDRALAHARRLIDTGNTVMIQPFVDSIESAGETGVILMNGEFSHAMRKGMMLGAHTLAEVEGLYKEEQIDPREASQAQMDLAHSAVAAAPFDADDLLYARVDMVPGDDGMPMLMELELTEPSLFMVRAPHSPQRFAEAIAAAGQRKRPGARPSAASPACRRSTYSSPLARRRGISAFNVWTQLRPIRFHRTIRFSTYSSTGPEFGIAT